MRFLINVVDKVVPNSANQSEMEAIDAFNQKLQDNQHWIFACGLEAPGKVKLIDNTNDQQLVENRPMFIAAENISGFWLINAKDEEEGLALALEASKACNRKVELRPLH